MGCDETCPCRVGEQSPSAEDLEISNLRALLEASQQRVVVLEARVAGAEQIGAAAMRERDQLKTASVLRAMDCVTLVLAEREACAALLEKMADDAERNYGQPGLLVVAAKGAALAARVYAVAIRARGGQ